MGSVYYLSHAANAADFADLDRLWAVVLLVILMSVVIHGVTAGRAIRHVVEADAA
jgi:NhaP-type Na+/H+ or K+/H+ antiporter